MTIVDYIVFFAFIGGIILYGCSFYFKSKSSENFTAAGGSIPTWLVGMSIFATYVSSISFLGNPGSAYSGNWNPFVFGLSIPVAVWAANKFFVPLYRKLNNVSAYNYLEVRFGYWARAYASICYLLTQIARTGSILFLLALPLNFMVGWSIPTIIVITGACVILYSVMGGIRAVIYTDAIQGIILIIGAIACAAVLTFSMPEGPGQLFEIAIRDHKFSLGSFGSSLSESTFWVVLVYGLFTNLQNYSIDQNYVQRYMTAKSTKAAKRSAMFGGLLFIPVSALFFYIGTALYAYYQASPELLPEGISGDRVFPYFIINALPQGITGLLIASIFAAGMSTVSTSVNSSATIILTDFYQRNKKRPTTNKENMAVLYISSFLFGCIGIIVGLLMMGVTGVLEAWWKLSSIFSGGMLGLFLLGFICPKVKNTQAMIAVIAGVLVIAWISLSPFLFTSGELLKFKSELHANLAIVFGTTTIFLVGFILSILIPNKKVKP
ncbi:sodium:solute symporter [Bacteroidales bacterium OttesenSCG-928-J19]|nr:sodium:solute symporter [Bacteroidales bacterium OttesenSCG-928-J19]